MNGKGSDHSRVGEAFRGSSYFCQHCGKGPSACRCHCPECSAVVSDPTHCIECGWVDQDALERERAANRRAMKKLSTGERFAMMFGGMKRAHFGVPSCYGSNPSPSVQAENDCQTCPHAELCLPACKKENLTFGDYTGVPSIDDAEHYCNCEKCRKK